MKRLALICLALAAIIGGAVWAGTRPNPADTGDWSLVSSPSSTPQTCFQQNMNAESLLHLTNEVRAKAGVPPLTLNEQLNTAATLKAQDMVKYHYWAHNNPSGATPWHWFDAVGYPYRYAEENLATDLSTPDMVTQGWVHSPGHYENMVSPHVTEVGFGAACGIVKDNKPSTVIVAEYGSR